MSNLFAVVPYAERLTSVMLYYCFWLVLKFESEVPQCMSELIISSSPPFSLVLLQDNQPANSNGPTRVL